MSKLGIRDICHMGIFVAVMAVCAQIRIPMPHGVPFTMQTFAVALAGIVLGARRGALAAAVYVLLGAMGAPVFGGLSGGLGIVSGPTGGFIVTFPVIALAAGFGAGLNTRIISVRIIYLVRGKILLGAALLAGTIVNLLAGMVWFAHITSTDMPTAFAVCVLPFLAGDAIKMTMAAALGTAVKTALKKSGLLA